MVYVIDINGNPLMPTERHGKVRRLLREGHAAVVRRAPFTIRLLYEVSGFMQDVTLGVESDVLPFSESKNRSVPIKETRVNNISNV